MADGIEGLGRVFNRLKQMATDTRHVERGLKVAGEYMLGSIEQNFREQGRPTKWVSLKASTLARRRKGKGKGSAQILIDRGRLKRSFSYRLTGEGLAIGTNVVYAPRQHFGYTGGVGRGRSKTPERPFLMFQDEDVKAIAEIFKRHIGRK